MGGKIAKVHRDEGGHGGGDEYQAPAEETPAEE
jgi:hypothetical protein